MEGYMCQWIVETDVEVEATKHNAITSSTFAYIFDTEQQAREAAKGMKRVYEVRKATAMETGAIRHFINDKSKED
jgi:hypothetical protein